MGIAKAFSVLTTPRRTGTKLSVLLIWLADFFCGWSVGVELAARLHERGSRTRSDNI